MKRSELRSRQRPFVLVSPLAAMHEPTAQGAVALAASHYEEPDRRFFPDAVLNAAHPLVEPAPVRLLEVDRRFAPELCVAGVNPFRRVVGVRPGSEEHSYRALLERRQPAEVLEHGPRVGVVPASNEQHWPIRKVVPVLFRRKTWMFPVLVVVGPRHDLQQPVLVVGDKGELSLAAADR